MVRRKQIEEPCQLCGKITSYAANAHQRKLRLGTKFFCSHSCSATFGQEKRRKELLKDRGIPYVVGVRLARLLGNAKGHQKTRKLSVGLTTEHLCELWISQKGLCALTNIPMSIEATNSMEQVSIDRIDSSVGYEVDNVQLVCLGINRLKSIHSNHDTKQFLTKLKKSL